MMTQSEKGHVPRSKKGPEEAPEQKTQTEAMAGEPTGDEQPCEVGLYEKITARTAEILEDGRRTFDEALKKAKEEITRAGEFSGEQVDKVGEFVRRDISENAGKARDAVRNAVDPQRLSAGVQDLFARILTGTADALSGLAHKTEKNLEYKTGEPTSAGTLTCKQCGAQMHLKHASRIPPCPKCHKTLFRKTY